MLQTVIDAIKNVFSNMQAIGWAPWPMVFAIVAAILVRMNMEEDVLNVNDNESKRKQSRAKILSLLVSYFVSVVACYGFSSPKNTQENIQALMFSILNAGLGYQAWSVWVILDPMGRLKDKWGRKVQPPDPPVQIPAQEPKP